MELAKNASQISAVIPQSLYLDVEGQLLVKYEMFIQQLREWLSTIYPVNRIDRSIKVGKDYKLLGLISNGTRTKVEFVRITACIWTFLHEYHIMATIHVDNQIIRSKAINRKVRAGEKERRMNYLSGGDFCQETWDKILNDIVKYEAEDVQSVDWKEQ